MATEDSRREPSFEKQFYGVATVGERGQVVIPAEARKQRGIETGDKVLFMASPTGKGLWMGKIDDVREFMTHFLQRLDRFVEESPESATEEASQQ